VLSRLHPPYGGWPFSRAATILGESLPPSVTERLALWLDRLAEWNAGVDLTAARGSDELVDLMVADALILSPRLPEAARVIDVGTGAGAPGLALAILRPDLRVTLVEPLGKRRAFLRSVIGSLNRLDVTLEGKTGEGLAFEREGAWDVALSRATLPPAEWLLLAERLLAHEGSAWVFLARESAPILAGMTEADTLSYAWPLTGAARRLIRYVKGGTRVQEGD
jgi:16S rRNA (guanine527-N7)-methyltransferase